MHNIDQQLPEIYTPFQFLGCFTILITHILLSLWFVDQPSTGQISLVIRICLEVGTLNKLAFTMGMIMCQ